MFVCITSLDPRNNQTTDKFQCDSLTSENNNNFEIGTETFNNDGNFASFNIKPPSYYVEDSSQLYLEVTNRSNPLLHYSHPIEGLAANFSSSDILCTENQLLELYLNDSNNTMMEVITLFEGNIISYSITTIDKITIVWV